MLELTIAQCIVPDNQIPNYHSILFDKPEAEFKENLLARTEAFMKSGAKPDLPIIPLPWVKSDAPPKSSAKDTQGYARNKTVFLYHVAAKILFQSPLEPVFADVEQRAKFLKMVGGLLEFTIQEIVPPFEDSQRDHRGSTPFEWVFGFSAWCGRLCASLTAAEARQVILDKIFKQDTETALLIMQSLTKSFMIHAFFRQKEITQDNMTLWSDITDWIFASPEWRHNRDGDHLDREFTTCAFAVLFCVAPDFSPLICGIDPGWPNLSKFVPLLRTRN